MLRAFQSKWSRRLEKEANFVFMFGRRQLACRCQIDRFGRLARARMRSAIWNEPSAAGPPTGTNRRPTSATRNLSLSAAPSSQASGRQAISGGGLCGAHYHSARLVCAHVPQVAAAAALLGAIQSAENELGLRRQRRAKTEN